MTRVDFDKKAVRRWRRDVFRALQSSGYNPAESMAGMVLAAVIAIGTDITAISALTGLSTDYALKVVKRLRKQRIVQGNTLSAAWAAKGDDMQHEVGAVLDCGVAAGVFVRSVDPKRSAAQKMRKPETRARGQRGPRKVREANVIAPPKIRASNPYFGLPEWEQAKAVNAGATPLELGATESAPDSSPTTLREEPRS